MRLTTFFLLAFLLNVAAKGVSQTVTFAGRNVPLEKVFLEIEKQTGYYIVCNNELLKNAEAVSLAVQDMPLRIFLNKVLQHQPLEYDIKAQTIVIKQKIVTAPVQALILPQVQPPVTGRIVDSKGKALQGVSVRIKGTATGTATDENGHFIIEAEPGKVLQVSYVGFEQQEFTVGSAAIQIIVLKESQSKLDEVQIIAYGSTSKRLNTGNVTTVKSEEIEKQPVTNVMHALQGLVPGLFIQQGSGMAGSRTSIMIRGRNSLNAGLLPLYVIDGVPFNGNSLDAQQSNTSIGGQPNGGNDPLNTLNPGDIESITVLKDADATAIYGSRGANGVVLITTKKGVAGRTRLDINVSKGAGKVAEFIPLLSTSEYLALRRQAFINDNRTPTAANAPDLLVWDSTKTTDYQRLTMGNTAEVTDITTSFSGGNQSTTFLMSGTYHNEGTVLLGNSKYRRAALNAKLNHTATDGKFKAAFSTTYSSDRNSLPGTDYVSGTYAAYPAHLPLYTATGNLYWFSSFTNPLATVNSIYRASQENLIMNGSLSYNVLPNLQVKVSGGHNRISLEQKQMYPTTASNPAFSNTAAGLYANNITTSYIVEPQINYNAAIAQGRLTAVAGGTYQATEMSMPYFVQASGFASNTLLENYASAGSITLRSAGSEYKFASVFGRATYDWDNKYVLNLSFRRDGSSRFGPDRRFGNFGSAGAAWIFSEEHFMKGLSWLSFGKLRASYGITGNDQIDNYGYMDTYIAGIAYGTSAAFRPSRIANPDFGWEKSKKLELATELGFFNNRLLINAAWFHNRTSSLLAAFPLSPQTGFSSYTANLDALLQNQGVELELKGTPVSTKDITWDLGFNITVAKNKLVSFPGLLTSTYANTYVIGQPLNTIRAYHFMGFTNGLAVIEDKNKDNVFSSGLFENGRGDYYIAGTSDPKYYGGMTSSLKYKNFQLDVLVNFVNRKSTRVFTYPGMINTQYKDVLELPYAPSAVFTSAPYTNYINYYTNSDAKIVDGSYVRLRNLSLSYNMPAAWIKVVKMKTARVYLRGQNLFTITDYKGFDPETQGSSLPPLRMLTAGVQCSF